jgi:hypothetical protein
VVIKDTSLRGKGAKFTSSDPATATVEDTNDGATVTIKKAGKVTIKGVLGEDSGSVAINIKGYTQAQWEAGKARFSKTELALVPKNPTDEINLLVLANGGTRNANGACNTCHTAQAKTLNIENNPVQIAGYTDDDIVTIYTMGKKPEGATMKSAIPPFAWGMFHAWTVSPEEKDGLIAYLRTQPLKANGVIDYGIYPCNDAGFSASPSGGIPPLCDKKGNPIMIPGLPGSSRSDAGTSTPASDAGSSTPAADAGTPAAGDAG